ncbi:MAG: hydrogenase maturation nickel metallochaperone HypA [Gammaproteobacteria bacterium]|nr:hydrogenase maturation nickel metallochaperone HypA [Gammaproteobacteria bacterium]
MHEAKLVGDLVSEVEKVALANAAGHVERIRIEIGALSHVMPETLKGHFEILAQGSPAQDAHLDITKSDDHTAKDAFDVRLVSIVVGSAW